MLKPMRPFSFAGVAAGLFVGVAIGALVARDQEQKAARAVRRAALLTEENERLRALVRDAERSKASARNKAQRQAVERAVAEIRGLPFKSAVNYEILDRKQIKETISAKLAEVYSEEEFAHITAALARLGLLERGYPLRQKYIDLLGEQVAAFYDQRQHKLFMFEDASLDNAQNRVVLAHELAHALQDQHFGLDKLPLEIKTNDDRAAAASALVEGEATLIMSEYMLKNLSLGALKDSITATFTQDMAQLTEAPAYLREVLIFPYLRGQEFCGALFGSGGYDRLTRAYLQPPSSTAQILHPDKYLVEPREEPLLIDWPETKANDQAPIIDNVLGELGIRILLTEWTDATTGERAATGWRGDRYLCFAGGDSLVWKTVWASDDDAREFMEAKQKALSKRYGADAAESQRIIRWLPEANAVLLIDALDEGWAQALQERFGKK